MTSYSEKYIKQIYPMQDIVLQTVQSSSNPFYLTGGTALNRAYLNIRYSDDLDFFINNDPDFPGYVKEITGQLVRAGFDYSEETLIVSSGFVSMFLTHHAFTEKLKVDFVNDIPIYYGKPVKTTLFQRTDCIENILTNKLSALIGRSEPKDVVDLVSIARNYNFSWDDAITKTEQKESATDSSLLAGILCEIKSNDLEKIKWTIPADINQMISDINSMAKDILCLAENSLCSG